MSKTLIVVESPKKAKTIQKILGDEDYQVIASGGHICDLPASDLGIDTTTFKMTYGLTERGKQSFARLKAAAARCEKIVLATDPDREGEAIAWHIAGLLRLKHPIRATFHEVTSKAINAALQANGRIDAALVDARQARRGTDRLIGYTISRPLSTLLKRKGLSTGRVQGAAKALLVEQERLIRQHVSREHYSTTLTFGEAETQWEARWVVPKNADDAISLAGNALLNHEQGPSICTSLVIASEAADVQQVSVTKSVRRTELRTPPPPLITSTMQQQAANRWGYDPEETMKAAQSLFEAGLISYHRTDKPSLSSEGIEAARACAAAQGLPLPETPNQWPSPPGAQEGHEAIRPSNIQIAEAGETEAEARIYGLIRLRTIQSQLAPAEFAVSDIVLGDEANRFEYRATARELTNEGYLKFASISGAGEADNPDEEKHEDALYVLPNLQVGSILRVSDNSIKKHRTTAPRRYTIASLMRKLEVLGIGRPATYATIFSTLFTRNYAEKAGKQLVPTTVCEEIYDAVYPTFSYADLAYTRRMEESLDAIASGRMKHTDLMRSVWDKLSVELASFDTTATLPSSVDAPAEPVIPCPKCSRDMKRVKGKFGEFWSCTGYGANKACTYTQTIKAKA